jgi:chromosome partitioning protein
MIVVVGGIKGGSGKTTLATNLTVMRALNSKKVLLVDADEQNSAYDWVDQRAAFNYPIPWTTIKLSGKYVDESLRKLNKDYPDIIVDAGGRDTESQRSALCAADVFVVPFKPRSMDTWTIGPLRRMIYEICVVNKGMRSLIVINQGDATGNDNQHAKSILSEGEGIQILSTVIGNRKSFANAASEGMSVIELPRKDEKAIQEMESLYNNIFSEY